MMHGSMNIKFTIPKQLKFCTLSGDCLKNLKKLSLLLRSYFTRKKKQTLPDQKGLARQQVESKVRRRRNR